jgi:hypothetical protein
MYLVDEEPDNSGLEATTKGCSMNRMTIKRILITLGVTAGVITATASQASAAINHSEPTLRSR